MSDLVVHDNMMDLFVLNQSSPATRTAYRYDLNKWLSWLGIRVPDARAAVEFRAYLESTLNPRSAARIFNTCRSFYRFVGGDNPFAALKSPRRIRNAVPVVPGDELIWRMLDSCDDTRDRLILHLLLNGLRAQEVCDLKADSITWSPEYGRDIIRVVGKGNKMRLVPATLETSRSLRGNSGATLPPDGHLIHGRSRLCLTMRQVEYVVERWSKVAGQIIRPHKLRHHYATRLTRNGTNVFALQRLLGHESIETTKVYVSLDLSDIVRESSKDPMNVVMEVTA